MATLDDLNEALKLNAGKFYSLKTKTEVTNLWAKLPDGTKNPMRGRLTKITTHTGIQGATSYEKRVQSMRDSAGLEPVDINKHSWAKRVDGDLYIHSEKGTRYLGIMHTDKTRAYSEYFLDGEPIKKEDILGLKEKKVNPKTEGTGRDLQFRLPKETSIISATVDGKVFDLHVDT